MISMIRRALLATATMVAPVAIAATPSGRTIPTVYEAGHFYAVPQTVGGEKLRLLVDTAGGGGAGMYWITAAAAKRLGLKTRNCTLGEALFPVADVPDYAPGRGLPPPLANRSPCGEALMIQARDYSGGDGQLGAGYFPGRIWTFDYPHRRLAVEDSSWQPKAGAHAVKLGFPRDEQGEATSGFARITIRVAGKTIDMLLDTGATAHPTKAGEKASGLPTVHGEGVASYITHGVFEHWHAKHPEWRVVIDGDDLFGAQHAARIIEVPRVEIAGWSVGPVWFTERADANLDQFMQWMDKKPDGAVGANVFRHFVMTIDYPDATAYFRCVDACEASGLAR